MRHQLFKRQRNLDKAHVLREAVVAVARVLNRIKYHTAAQIVIGILMLHEDSTVYGVKLDMTYHEIATAIAIGDPDKDQFNEWSIFCRYYFAHIPPFFYFYNGSHTVNLAMSAMNARGIVLIEKTMSQHELVLRITDMYSRNNLDL